MTCYLAAITTSLMFQEKEIYEKKRELNTVWYKLLNQRKQAYWNAIMNENLADTYENWKNREQIIFPRKFRNK